MKQSYAGHAGHHLLRWQLVPRHYWIDPTHELKGGSVRLLRLFAAFREGASVRMVVMELPATPAVWVSSETVCDCAVQLTATMTDGLPSAPLRMKDRTEGLLSSSITIEPS